MGDLKELIFVAVLSGMAAVVARGAEVKLIANPGVKVSEISADDLKGVFLVTKTSLANGSHVEPVLLKSGAAHETFVKQYVGKTDSALAAYYRTLVFTGKAAMPKSFTSEAEMVEYVAKIKGAIGYLSAGARLQGVKVIQVK